MQSKTITPQPGNQSLCARLHSHAPEPKNYAYRTDNTGTTNPAKSSKSTRGAKV